MHEGVWSTVLGLFSLMTIAVLILPLSKKVKIPYTVLLALVGIIIGFLNSFIVGTQTELCLLYTSPSPRDVEESRMPSYA